MLPGITCNKVLCWVASCETADATVEVAKALAREDSGVVHVIMCLDPAHGVMLPDRKPRSCPRPLTPELIGEAEQRLCKLYGSQVHGMILPGNPLKEICRYARRHEVDLIVYGEQGLAVERDYGGCLSDEAPCAVMTLVLPRETGSRETTERRSSLGRRVAQEG